jgi:hypothetical protein
MSNNKRDLNRLVVGGPPRADLLPPEVKSELKSKSQRRGLIAIVVVAIILVFAGYAGASTLAVAAQLQLSTTNNRTAELLSEQGSYSEVNEVLGQVAIGDAAILATTSTEIEWGNNIVNALTRLPAGVYLESVVIKAASPMTPMVQATVPLQPSRMAEITYVFLSPNVVTTADLIDTFPQTLGFSSVRMDSSTFENGLYTTTVRLHLDERALSSIVSDEEEGESE